MPDTTKPPKELHSAQDYDSWNDWIMHNGATGALPGSQINGLQKTLNGWYKMHVEAPLKLLQILSRSGEKGLPFRVPILEQVMQMKTADAKLIE